MRTSLVVSALIAVLASPVSALDITSCYQTIPEREVGVLQNDLDCPLDFACMDDPTIACSAGCPTGGCGYAAAVLIAGRGSLDLNGHTIKGGGGTVVICNGRCSIVGPGTLDAAGLGTDAIFLMTGKESVGFVFAKGKGGGRFTISNLDMNGGGVYMTGGRRLDIDNVTITDSQFSGISFQATVNASNVTISNSAHHGIDAVRLKGTGLIVTGNPQIGVGGVRKLKLTDSVVTGNLVDLATNRPPRISATTCGRSINQQTDQTWSVCNLD